MIRNKDAMIAAIIAAVLIALIAVALIGAFGVVTVNAEESSSAATFDFPAATKFIGEGDTYTVNYYSPDGTKIAEQIVPYMSTVPMIVGCEDYSVVYDIAIPEEDNVFSIAGVEGDFNQENQHLIENAMFGYSVCAEGQYGAIIPITATENIKLEATVDDQSIVMNGLEENEEFGHVGAVMQCDSVGTSFLFASVLDPSTIMISSLSVDGVELIHNNIATIPVDILYRTSNIDVVNLIVNDYDGGEVDFFNFSTKFVSGTTESVTVNFLSPDLKPISSTTISADQTLPVLAGYDNYTMIQKIPYIVNSSSKGFVFDGVFIKDDDESPVSPYGALSFNQNHTGAIQILGVNGIDAIKNATVSIDFDGGGQSVHFVPTEENYYTMVNGNQLFSSMTESSFALVCNTVNVICYPSFQLRSFVVDGYDYVREDGLMQFPYTAEQLAGFTPNTDVINLIVDDYVAPDPEQPDDDQTDPAPTPGGDTGEIDQPDNPTVTAPNGNWFTETWDKIVQWFKGAGEAIKNWFIEVGQWFNELFN